jgi:hypothetical protein
MQADFISVVALGRPVDGAKCLPAAVVSGVYKSTIVRDAEYALREKREAPIERVQILEHVRGNRWKAQWIDPNSGLVHYVESGHLLCPWKQLKAFLREESDAERLRQHNVECGWVKDSPVDQALYQVFENVGDDVSYYRGVLTSKPEPLGACQDASRNACRQVLTVRLHGSSRHDSHTFRRSRRNCASVLRYRTRRHPCEH